MRNRRLLNSVNVWGEVIVAVLATSFLATLIALFSGGNIIAAIVASFFSFFAVFLPHQLSLSLSIANKDRFFNFWSLKFSLTIFLLVVSARFLSDNGLFSSLFILGVLMGIFLNVFLAFRSNSYFSHAEICYGR